MPLLPDLRIQARFTRWARFFSAAVITGALIVLAGWAFNIDLLLRHAGHSITVNPLTAISFFLCGFSLLMIGKNEGAGNEIKLAWALLALVFIIALVRILDYLGNLNANWDLLLFRERVMATGGVRMSVMTAASFLLTTLALAQVATKKFKGFPFFQYAALALGLAAWLAFLGYVYQVSSIWDASYGPMALYTSLGFLFISFAILLSQPGVGIMAHFTQKASGSVAIRMFVPAAILLPSFLGWLRMYGDWSGLYPSYLGISLYTLSFILIFLGVAWYIAVSLNRRDLLEQESEVALAKSEEQFAAIFNGAPDAVVLIDGNSNVVMWNPEAEQLFQWTGKEAVGRNLKDLIIPGEFHYAHDKGIQRYQQTGIPSIMGKTVDMVGKKKDRSEVDISLRISPLIMDGKYFFVGFIRDITEQKSLQVQLQEFNRELSRQVEVKTRELTQIFEQLTDAFIALDRNLRYTYLNSKAGRLIHRDPKEMIGKYVWDEFPDAVGSATYNAFNKALREQIYIMNVDHYEPLDLWQENHIYPSDSGLVVFIRDITEKKLAEIALQEKEARYRTLVEEASDAILVFSPVANHFVEVNKKAVELLGYSMEELLRIDGGKLPFTFSSLSLPLRRLENGESVSVETMVSTKEGKEIMVETSAKKLPDGNYLAFMRDITQRKQAEEELRRLNEELRVLTGHLHKVREEERTHIAREIHDELGQQLTVMKMDASWLNKRLSETDELIRAKLNQLLTMIDHTVKSIRRISSELRPSLLDDLGLVAAMEWHLDEFERRSGIAKVFESDTNPIDLPDVVKINLFRIFQESLTNVARHADATEVKVRLKEDNNGLILTIADNGKGLPENSGRKTLGILGMKERTLMIGGEFQITGEPAKGTKVTVVIPASN